MLVKKLVFYNFYFPYCNTHSSPQVKSSSLGVDWALLLLYSPDTVCMLFEDFLFSPLCFTTEEYIGPLYFRSLTDSLFEWF